MNGRRKFPWLGWRIRELNYHLVPAHPERDRTYPMVGNDLPVGYYDVIVCHN